MNPDRLSWDAYWTLCRRIRREVDPTADKARRAANFVLYSDHIRKLIFLTEK